MPSSPAAPSFTPPPTVMHWFRRDLRVADNPSLNAAIARSRSTNRPLVPLYVVDPADLSPSVTGRVRARFILETVSALSASLRAHSAGRLDLRVLRGPCRTVVPATVAAWHVSDLFFERAHAPDDRDRDAAVEAAIKQTVAASHGGADDTRVNVQSHNGFTLYDPRLLLQEADGHAPATMQSFIALVDHVGHPARPVAFPSAEASLLSVLDPDSSSLLSVPPDADTSAPDFAAPSLEDLGYSATDDDNEAVLQTLDTEHFPGGEDVATARLDAFLAREGGRVAARFSKPETSPAAIRPRATTVLSPYLAVGALSSRTFYAALRDMQPRVDKKLATQTTLRGQLLWREHFWLLAHSTPHFGRIADNPVCRPIPWRDSSQTETQNLLAAWREARTGYPWIDALMTQLRVEGFVHHLGRHSLACFLTRGDLWVSWEEGAAVFERYLLDYDFALNSANWMWLSCSAFFNRFFRVYSPVAFAKKWDKDGEFIKHYVPVLRKMPTKYIHEPWKAPVAVQRSAGCVIGRDYPKPIVEHGTASKANIAKMQAAFAAAKSGGNNSAPARKSSAPARNKSPPRKRARAS